MKNIFFAVACLLLVSACVQFDTNGKVTSIVRTSSGGNKENAEILYDGLDKIETISFESDDPWINVLTYGDGERFQAPVTYTTTNQMGNYTEVTYQRDSTGIIKRTITYYQQN